MFLKTLSILAIVSFCVLNASADDSGWIIDFASELNRSSLDNPVNIIVDEEDNTVTVISQAYAEPIHVVPLHVNDHEKVFYGIYQVMINKNDLVGELKKIESFDLQRDPWLGFAMRFNGLLDEFMACKNHSKLADLKKLSEKVYKQKIDDGFLTSDNILQQLTFGRFSNWLLTLTS
jgi:hypothetical protein